MATATATAIVTDELADEFLARCQNIVDAYMEKHFPNQYKTLSLSRGRRYRRIEARSAMKGQEASNASAWGFIDTHTGDVLKSDGWKKPAKHARGNLFDEKQGMGWVGPYGPANMR